MATEESHIAVDRYQMWPTGSGDRAIKSNRRRVGRVGEGRPASDVTYPQGFFEEPQTPVSREEP